MDVSKFIEENFLVIIIGILFLYYILYINDKPRIKTGKKENYENVKECSKQMINKEILDYIYDPTGRYVRPATSI